MNYRVCICLTGLAGLLVAQQTPAPPAPPTPPPPPPAWSAGGIDFSGLIDGYYSFNANHPASGANNLRNFDVKANQFSLNMAKLVMEHAAEPVGFRVDLGFGRAFEIIHGGEKAPDVFRHLEQAFVSLKPPKAGGLQVDFGKFVTSAGAEVIETHSNWNYSRSVLFAWAIPYYHFGARVSKPVNAHWTPGFQIVNGWNNVEDNNSGKTIGLTNALTSSKANWYVNYYAGPEKSMTNKGYRHLFDTTVLLTPHPKANFYVNYDYGVDKAPGGDSSWSGVAVAARFAPNDWFALAPRIEYFNDKQGFSTGTAQKIKEFTLTAEFKHSKGFLSRLEYRRDWSDQPFFDRGNQTGNHKSMDTLLAGFVVYFGPK